MHEKVQFWGMFLLHVRRPFQWEELFILQVLSCLQCIVLLQVGLYVPADSCTNGRADLSGSIMSWLVKMECDENACASCFQRHQHSCQLWSDHSIEIFFTIFFIFLLISKSAICWLGLLQQPWVYPLEVLKSQLVTSVGMYESINKVNIFRIFFCSGACMMRLSTNLVIRAVSHFERCFLWINSFVE